MGPGPTAKVPQDLHKSNDQPGSAGNVREQSLTEIYRNSPLMRELRDPEALHGRCRQCEYRSICGGSRSRAYALNGDYLATDPWCPYQPHRASA